jgi:hypothetical protein
LAAFSTLRGAKHEAATIPRGKMPFELESIERGSRAVGGRPRSFVGGGVGDDGELVPAEQCLLDRGGASPLKHVDLLIAGMEWLLGTVRSGSGAGQ